MNANGMHAAVLEYRLKPNSHPKMIHDAQRAMRIIRERADAWRVDESAVAVLGFSAGGHLASTLAVHYDEFANSQDDLISISARPDAAVLCYAVIDLGTFAHQGSLTSLLGESQDASLIQKLSNHEHVTEDTPPTFLWHTAEDPAVHMNNSLQFAMACKANGVPVELHVYEAGRHGLGLAEELPGVATWASHCVAFLKRHLVK
jgi:acetyl esterase/lipase